MSTLVQGHWLTTIIIASSKFFKYTSHGYRTVPDIRKDMGLPEYIQYNYVRHHSTRTLFTVDIIKPVTTGLLLLANIRMNRRTFNQAHYPGKN